MYNQILKAVATGIGSLLGYKANPTQAENKEKTNTETQPVNDTKKPEDAIWKQDNYPRFEGTGTLIHDVNSGRATLVDKPSEDLPFPQIREHKVFVHSDNNYSSGTLLISLDKKGRLCVHINRLTAHHIDNRGRNIYIDSISEGDKLTDTQKNLITAIFGSDMSVSSDCKLTTSLSRFKSGGSIKADTKGFYDQLEAWSKDAHLPEPSQQTIDKLIAETSEPIILENTPENRSALLKTILDLESQGKLKGNPGDIIAIVGNGVSDSVKVFKPRWVLRNGNSPHEYR